MRIARTKIVIFFLGILLLGWLLYPREIFLGFIYEGFAQLARSEMYYRAYLSHHPHSKFATLRLVGLYERMGEPEKARPWLEQIYQYRKTDWELAQKYLQYLEDAHDDEGLYRARREIAQTFATIPRFPKNRVESLLALALQQAIWQQKTDDAYAILADIIPIATEPRSYIETVTDLDRALGRTEKVLTVLEEKLTQHPHNEPLREEVATLYAFHGKLTEAFQLIDAGLQIHPTSAILQYARILLDERAHNDRQMRADCEQLLQLEHLPEDLRIDTMEKLAILHERAGEWEESLRVAQLVRQADPEESDRWIVVLDGLVHLHRIDEAIRLLHEYLNEFPDDPVREQDLIELYLYEKKDLTQLPRYRAYFAAHHQPEMALDVAALLVEAKRFTEALEFTRTFLAVHSAHAAGLVQAAEISASLGRMTEAAKYYERVGALKSHDAQWAKKAGMGLYAIGRVAAAIPHLERATTLRADDAESWFWLAESYYATGANAEGRQADTRVVALLAGHTHLNASLTPIALKSRGRVDFTPAIIEDYHVAIARSRDTLGLREDLIDLLIEHQQFDQAHEALDAMSAHYPNERKVIRSLRVYLAMAERDWKGAIPALQAIIADGPTQWSSRRDLAEAYYHIGAWRKALQEYEAVAAATGDKYKIADVVRELHEVHDYRVGQQFDLIDYGADALYEWGSTFQGHLHHDWTAEGQVKVGHFRSRGIGFSDDAEYGRVTIANHHLHDWVFRGGIGFGVSGSRKTVAPRAEITYQPSDTLRLTGSYFYRGLRVDLPQAVAAGAVEDVGQIEWYGLPHRRIILAGRYELNRSYIPGGARAWVHTLEPSLYVVVSRRPYATIGYQFTYTHLVDPNGFAALVPLVPDIRAHYLTGLLAHRFHHLALEGGFFLGEDTARHLHLFRGDLWGARATAKWNIFPWLDLESAYSYGKETSTLATGRSHQVHVGLSGHWLK